MSNNKDNMTDAERAREIIRRPCAYEPPCKRENTSACGRCEQRWDIEDALQAVREEGAGVREAQDRLNSWITHVDVPDEVPGWFRDQLWRLNQSVENAKAAAIRGTDA